MADGCIDANPDVSGIGVRINFYLTMWLVSIIPATPWTESLLGTLHNNAGIASLGLLVTAIVQTAQNQLSLYHALFISHILFFFGGSVHPAGSYRWNPLRITILVVLQIGVTVATLGWSLYVWVHVREFGSQSQCNNSIKYVFFFANVRPTVGWFRRFSMAILILSAIFAGISLIVWGVSTVVMSARLKEFYGSEQLADEGVRANTETQNFYISWPSLAAAIYSTVMLELYVKRNKHLLGPEENDWSFGQVLSMVMILGTLNEVMLYIYSLLTRGRRSNALSPSSSSLFTPS
ncbi:hypothetical protein OF83DRAFT_1106364 [Amylostereum chailletii]|nr:hypothetical protein OF83DRAFT_1106364 [Amylostereum chailletii]